MLPIHFNPRKTSDYIFHILLPVIAVGLPLLFVSIDLPVMPRITTTQEQVFGLFSFCMWCVLFLVAYREIKARPGISFEEGIVILLPLLTSFFFLVLVVEYAQKSWDYENYENAFRAVVIGDNPYNSGHYLYPPLFAQVMAGVYRLGEALFGTETLNLWLFVFYIHQCIQFFLCNLAYQLSSRFAAHVGVPDLQNRLIVTGLFLFNFPLIRMLHLNQINLYILNATLIALLTLGKFPFWSGAAVAIGGLIKLYPLIMGAPLVLMRKWKALLGAFVSMVVVILLQTSFGQDFHLWRRFVLFFLSFPAERESSIWIRNTTVLSLARHIVTYTGLPEAVILPLTAVGTLAILVWISVRFYRREKTYSTLPPGAAAEAYRNFGNLIDFASLALLITPSAWDHHFVIAVPLAIWAVALIGREKPWQVAAAVSFIFVLPPFDVFPFSFLRMFGVLALLILTSPNILLKPLEEESTTSQYL